MDQKYFDHFFPDPNVFGVSENYDAPKGRGPRLPERDRIPHADRLLGEYRKVLESATEDRQSRLAQSLPVMDGIQLEFLSKEGSRLVLASLEGRGEEVYLLNERYVVPEGAPPFQVATVHLPSDPRGIPNAYFSDRITQYRDKDTKKGAPRYDLLIRSIESIRLANLNSFWFGMDVEPPDDKTEIWCEVWLNRPDDPSKKRKKRVRTNGIGTGETAEDDPSDVVTRFRQICRQLEIECRPNALQFPEQEVVLVRANGIQLQGLVDSVEMLSSINPYRDPATFFLDMEPREQPEWIADMCSRLRVLPNPTSSVCVLDTGVNNGHPLLAPVIPDAQRHSVNMDDDVADFRNATEAHGTEMCGVAAFGDLTEALGSTHSLIVDHAVESVKIRSEGKEIPPELFGQITDRAINLVDSIRPELKRVACLAVTADGLIDGTPSSWSATIDKLAFGDELNEPDLEAGENELPIHKRLFVISAGNLRNQDDWANYPTSNISAAIEDPAQSWNALTVGAYTNKAEITELGTEGYTTVAPNEALSPVSRTSVSWDRRWPLKPDIVLEGGNAAKSPQGEIVDFESLAVLTTAPDWAVGGKHFAPFVGTSPATAHASWMAAKVFAACPEAWPETVRGLLVHSAQWTDAMKVGKSLQKKGDVKELLRTVGYGVPVLPRALKSARNSLTMILQDDLLQPCVKDGSNLKFNSIRLFDLPWPRDILRDLGEEEATIRITLSYFIAPSPGRKGWGNRYRYPSHGLRFDLNNIGEDRAVFFKRLNAKKKTEEDEIEDDTEETSTSDSGSARWMVGEKRRHLGSIHTDIWSGPAVNMVDTRYVAVYPTGGWWKERPQFGHGERSVRFSLLVSLEVPETASINGVPVDLYSAVQQEIATRLATHVPTVAPITIVQ